MSVVAQLGRTRIIHQGVEQEPVIVIEGFDPDPNGLIEAAAARDYVPIGRFFPGVRAPVEPARVAAMRRSLAGLIRQVFGLHDELNRIESYYSLVTTPAARPASRP